jgi:hypothetical protein
MHTPDTDIEKHLHTLFAGTIQSLDPCWEPCEWSRVYRLTLRDGTHLFVKGTPRTRNEALVTQRLSTLCPRCIPRVLMADLVPAAPWRWFLLEDAGETDPSPPPRLVAIEAARTLGRLQQRASEDQVLPGLLAGCEAEQLQAQALAVCRWAMQQSSSEAFADLQRIAAHLQEAQTFFRDIAERLTDLPSTVVHGDFWSGSIAVAGQELRFIDWGDALWGVGGISLVTLIATSEGQLDEAEAAIWQAYEQGWERPIRQPYREVCQVASTVADLMIDTAIATSCGRGPERLPGLLPGLRELEALVTR